MKSLNALSGIGGVQTGVGCGLLPQRPGSVLMPCRALEAFRRSSLPASARPGIKSLNALSGIGGVQTQLARDGQTAGPGLRLNALSGIGGVQTTFRSACSEKAFRCLNALSGIGGVQTQTNRRRYNRAATTSVLMPCRALEAFRRRRQRCPPPADGPGLNALSGIGGVQTLGTAPFGCGNRVSCLNALSGIGGVQTQRCWPRFSSGGCSVLMPCRALEAFRPPRGGNPPDGAGGAS